MLDFNQIFTWKRAITTSLLLAVFLVGYQIGANNIEEKEYVVREGGYKYINPILECNVEGVDSDHEYIPFESVVRKEIKDEMKEAYDHIEYSVYFRNLNNGPWFGINENAQFSPASLLKVPIMIAYYKLAETDRTLLDKKITITGEYVSGLVPEIISEQKIKKDNTYSIGELIDSMIISSDNHALQILFDEIEEKNLMEVYNDLGVKIPNVRQPEDFMSVKEYASFFRILYNASYLNREYSERALSLLSRSAYKDGLVSGIVPGIDIAHKFGEREYFEDGKQVKQLHECGIVYYSSYPYLLCVMTRGDNLVENSKVISKISKIIFTSISNIYN